MNKYDIVLAGLLHDIGKFFEKANIKGQSIAGIEVSTEHHGITSSNFINHFSDKLAQAGFDVEAVATMAQRHHEYKGGGPASVEDAPIEYRPYCYIIDKADNLSSSERLNTRASDGSWQLRQLTNPFSILAGRRYSQEAGIFGEVYSQVTDENRLNSEVTNLSMLESFITDFGDIGIYETSSQLQFINDVNSILKKYTWCYPSDTREYIRDISLYSHLETTAALADVLYEGLVSNSNFKRGLSEDKRNLGWEFTEASIKELRISNIALIKINLANAMDLMMSSNISNTLAIQKFLMECKEELWSRIQRFIGITDVNTICSDDFSYTLLLSESILNKVIDAVKEFNRQLPQIIGKTPVFFESAYSLFSIETLIRNETGKILDGLDKTLSRQWENSKDGIGYFGIDSLMVKSDGKWGDVKVNRVVAFDLKDSISLRESRRPEIKSLLNSKVLALVKVSVINYTDIISKALSMTFNDVDSILDIDKANRDKQVGTICRLGAMLDQINKTLNLERPDCVYLYRGNDGIIFLTTLENAFKAGPTHQRIIFKQSSGQIKTSVSISTIYSKNIAAAYKVLNATEVRADEIYYNGYKISYDQFSRIPGLMQMVKDSASLKSSKGNLYKILEFCGMYEMYKKTGDTHYMMCIPRFKYNAARNFTASSITDEFRALVTEEFNKASRLEETDLILLKLVVYDTLQQFKTIIREEN